MCITYCILFTETNKYLPSRYMVYSSVLVMSNLIMDYKILPTYCFRCTVRNKCKYLVLLNTADFLLGFTITSVTYLGVIGSKSFININQQIK